MHVLFSDESLQDLRDIWNFVRESSEVSADNLVVALIERAHTLREMPLRHPEIAELKGSGVRRLNVRTWSILYRVRADYIDVVRVVHGGRDQPTLSPGED